MYIAFVASEGVPFSKTGGLADVVGAPVSVKAKRAEALGVTLDKLSLPEMQKIEPAVTADVFQVLDLDRAIDSRTGIGALSRINVAAELEAWNAILREQP